MSGWYTSEEDEAEPVIHARTLRDAIVDQNDPEAPGVGAALEYARATGEHLVVAILGNAVALAYRETQRPGDAVAAADQALGAARLAGAVEEEVRALTTLAMARLELGDFVQARADLDQARAAGPLDPLLAVAGAAVARHAGEIRLAVTLLEGVVADPSVGGVTRFKALNNLADVLMESHPVAALALLDQAAPLATLANPIYVPVLRANRGLAQAYAGDLPAALADLRAAEVALAHLQGGVLNAEFEAEFARVLGQLRLLAEARAASGRALDALTGPGTELMRADALMGAGRLAAADGDREAAHALFTQAYGMYVVQGRPAGVAIASMEVQSLSGDAADADVIARQAAALAELGLDRDAARGWLAAAEVAARRGRMSDARAHWERAASLPGADPAVAWEARARSALAMDAGDVARDAIDKALALIDARAAIATAPDLRHRMAADRVRFELLARERPPNLPDDEVDALLRGRPPSAATLASPTPETEDLRLQWRELARRVDSADEDRASLITLGAQLAETERALRASAWTDGSGGAGRRPAGLADLPERMPFLAIARIRDEAVAWSRDKGARGGRRVVLGPWARWRGDLDQLARVLARIAAGAASAPVIAGAHALVAELDEPLSGLLASSNRPPLADPALLVILDRGLESAPLLALPCLWGRAATLTSLAVTRAAPGPRPLARAAGVSVATGPRLSHADAEADVIAGVWGGARRVVTAPDLLAGLKADAIVHIAAHATFRWDNALQSVIHLADGPLALSEVLDVARARFAAGNPLRLAYFAACSLASAPTDTALPGAITTLAEHGIESVIASSIPLPDAHSAWISEAVHAAVCRGETPATGLAQARARVDLTDPADAVAWAALACLGVHTALP